jgi:dimethylamine corrinoid protein
MAAMLEKAKEVNANIMALSALLTTTMVKQRELIEALEQAGLRQHFKLLVGAAPVTRDWAQKIVADGYGEDAIGAVTLAQQLVKASADILPA